MQIPYLCPCPFFFPPSNIHSYHVSPNLARYLAPSYTSIQAAFIPRTIVVVVSYAHACPQPEIHYSRPMLCICVAFSPSLSICLVPLEFLLLSISSFARRHPIVQLVVRMGSCDLLQGIHILKMASVVSVSVWCRSDGAGHLLTLLNVNSCHNHLLLHCFFFLFRVAFRIASVDGQGCQHQGQQTWFLISCLLLDMQHAVS